MDVTKKGKAKPGKAAVSWFPHNFADGGGMTFRGLAAALHSGALNRGHVALADPPCPQVMVSQSLL